MNPAPTPSVPMHPNKRDSTQIEVLIGMGASLEYVSAHLNLSSADLQRYYEKEIQHAEEEANLRVAKVFHDLATSGDFPQMTQAWMEMRARWSKSTTTSSLLSKEEQEAAHQDARQKLLRLLNRGK